MKHGSLLSFCGVALLLLIARPTDADWADIPKPNQRPEFREAMPLPQFTRQLQLARAKLKISEMMKQPLPAAGIRVTAHTPNSQAANLNIQPGDIIAKINNVDAWENFQPIHKTRTAEVWRKGKKRVVQFNPGGVGVHYAEHWKPELLYLRGKQRNAKWDTLVLLGILRRQTNPALAETAWHEAIKAGYKPDFLSDQCGVEIALKLNRPSEAMQFAWFAMQADPKRGELVHPDTLFRAALANNRLRTCKQIVERFPTAFEIPSLKSFDAMIKLESERPAHQRAWEAPSVLSQKWKHKLFNVGFKGQFAQIAKMFIDAHSRKQPYTLAAESGRFYNVDIYPDRHVTGMRVELDYTIKPTDNKVTMWDKAMHISIRDSDVLDKRELRQDYTGVILHVQIRSNGSVYLATSGEHVVFNYRDAGLVADGKKTHKIRFFIAGGRGEIHIDGGRVALVPVPFHAKNLHIAMSVTGTTMVTKSFGATEIAQP